MNFATVVDFGKQVLNYCEAKFEEFKLYLVQVSTETIEWIGILALHGATVPTLLGLMTGVTDFTPPIDMVLISWAALTMFFIKAVIRKNVLNILTIGLGFVCQSVLMALIFFK